MFRYLEMANRFLSDANDWNPLKHVIKTQSSLSKNNLMQTTGSLTHKQL